MALVHVPASSLDAHIVMFHLPSVLLMPPVAVQNPLIKQHFPKVSIGAMSVYNPNIKQNSWGLA
jgi:hypothetical protein